MVKIPEYFHAGDNEELTPKKLLDIIQDMYKDLAVAINKKPDVFVRTTDGLTTDTRSSVGDININSSTGKVQVLVAHDSQTSVDWSTGFS